MGGFHRFYRRFVAIDWRLDVVVDNLHRVPATRTFP